MSSDASLTNIEMVKPRGPRVFLAVLALAAVGGAAWWLTRPAGPVAPTELPDRSALLKDLYHRLTLNKENHA